MCNAFSRSIGGNGAGESSAPGASVWYKHRLSALADGNQFRTRCCNSTAPGSNVRFRADIDPDTVVFETGYAQAARASYEVFRTLQREGVIPPGVRFQVCLPTPMASAYMYVSPKAREAYISVYERALMRALQDILASIPAPQLAIQWDVCQEVLIYENFFPERPVDYKRQIVAELARLGAAVPEAVEMGYHLCYGSPADEHLVMPRDMAIMVEIANGVRKASRRRIDFLHMSVPKDRTDGAYFRPLTDLARSQDTTL